MTTGLPWLTCSVGLTAALNASDQGILWTGAVCSIRDTGIAANNSLGGLYVDFNGANNMNLEMASSTFENNTPRHIDVRAPIDYDHTETVFRVPPRHQLTH